MKLSEFSQATGLTNRQIRRLCDNQLIPFEILSTGRKRFSADSIAAADIIYSTRTHHLYLGPLNSSSPNDSYPLLPMLSETEDSAESIYNYIANLLKRRYVKKITVNLNFHPSSIPISTKLSAYCLNNNVEFHGGYHV